MCIDLRSYSDVAVSLFPMLPPETIRSRGSPRHPLTRCSSTCTALTTDSSFRPARMAAAEYSFLADGVIPETVLYDMYLGFVQPPGVSCLSASSLVTVSRRLLRMVLALVSTSSPVMSRAKASDSGCCCFGKNSANGFSSVTHQSLLSAATMYSLESSTSPATCVK